MTTNGDTRDFELALILRGARKVSEIRTPGVMMYVIDLPGVNNTIDIVWKTGEHHKTAKPFQLLYIYDKKYICKFFKTPDELLIGLTNLLEQMK